MLATLLVTIFGDNFRMLVIEFRYWWYIFPTLMLKYRGFWWQKRRKLSLTSQSCGQHISSPTSVTNIDVTVFIILKEKTQPFFLSNWESFFYRGSHIRVWSFVSGDTLESLIEMRFLENTVTFDLIWLDH